MPKPIPLLLETIKIEEGKIYNLEYHQKRCNHSRETLYGIHEPLVLKTLITPPPKGLYRCRILYHKQVQSIEYIPYTPKPITSLQIIHTAIDYHHKYANRDIFNSLSSIHSHTDDIILCKDDLLTDTTMANIAFYDGSTWLTPEMPLLHGTTREKLIDEGFLTLKNIKMEDLSSFSHVALMNAMIGFKILKNITLFDSKGKTYDY